MPENANHTEDDGLIAGTVVATAIHAVLLAFLCILLHSAAHVFMQMYADFATQLPGPTQVVAGCSSFATQHTIAFVFTAVLFLVADGATCFLARLFLGPAVGKAWAIFVGVLLAAAIGGTILAMFLPIFRMTCHVAAQFARRSAPVFSVMTRLLSYSCSSFVLLPDIVLPAPRCLSALAKRGPKMCLSVLAISLPTAPLQGLKTRN